MHKASSLERKTPSDGENKRRGGCSLFLLAWAVFQILVSTPSAAKSLGDPGGFHSHESGLSGCLKLYTFFFPK